MVSINTISATDHIDLSESSDTVEQNDIDEISNNEINIENGNKIKNLENSEDSTFISDNGTTINYNSKEKFNVILLDSNNNKLSNKEISVCINNVNYTRITDENGVASLTINLFLGDYNVNYCFNGDNTYSASKGESIIHVVQKNIILNSENLVMNQGSGESFKVTITDENNKVIANENIVITINGINYIRTSDEDGVASIKINLVQGIYSISYKIQDNTKYKSEKKTKTIYIYGQSYLSSSDLNIAYGSKESFEITYHNSLNQLTPGITINIKINGKTYTRVTDEKGVAKLNINLNPGNYIIEYDEGNNFGKNNINIKTSEIIGNNLEINYGSENYYTITLKDNFGNPISQKEVIFIINGVSYSRTTNSEGMVSIRINLNPGDYIINTVYNGNNEYKGNSIENIIKVINPNTITVTGKPSCVSCHNHMKTGNIKYVDYTNTFINYCPLCNRESTLIINPKGVYEGEITCSRCSADYCIVCGSDKMYTIRATLTNA